MTADSPSHLVPRLRFPEFEKEPGWKPTQLSSVAHFVNDRVSVSAITKDEYVSTENILPDFAGVAPPSSFPASGSVTSFRINDVLIANIRPYLKKVWRATRSGGASNDVLVVRSKSGTSADYLAALLQSDVFIKYVMGGAKGVKMPRGDIGLIKQYPVGMPEPAEQQKIADCLGSLDDLIAAEDRKLEALRQHNQGLMQQLFPQPGETVPRLRFREFHNAGEWKVEKLDDLAKRGSGHTPNKAKTEYYNGGIKWVSLADSTRLDNGLIFETAIEISEEGIKNSSAVLHPAGTVILSRDAGVGKSAIIGSPMAVSQHFIAWTCEPTKLSNWFLYYQLQCLKPVFERNATGSTIKTIGLPFFKGMRVTVPPRLAEQQRIANCLSVLDDRIASQARRLEALKQHKQGLLQQIFPSLEGQ